MNCHLAQEPPFLSWVLSVIYHRPHPALEKWSHLIKLRMVNMLKYLWILHDINDAGV